MSPFDKLYTLSELRKSLGFFHPDNNNKDIYLSNILFPFFSSSMNTLCKSIHNLDQPFGLYVV